MDTQTKEPSKNTSNEVYKENKENNLKLQYEIEHSVNP